MITSDYHIHTEYSFDSKESMENIAHNAIERGLQEIALTDHYETLDPGERLDQVIDYREYIQELDRVRARYGDRLRIKLGSEINMEIPMQGQIESCLREHPFDFVIGSLHAVDFVDVGMHSYYQELSVDEYHRKYFEDLLRAVNSDFTFSVLGHIDFVTRYGGYRNNVVSVKKHHEVLTEIMKKVISTGRGIELNTSALRYGLKDFHPSQDILRLYRELGGEIITIGSDSHTAGTLAQDFKEAEALLLHLGYRYYSVFERMRPNFLRLG